jgi:hypothetical protein
MKKQLNHLQRYCIAFDFCEIEDINKKRLKLHDHLRKFESALTTQIRTKKIDFANFLHRRKNLEINTSTCRCDWHRQTVKHVIMLCSLMSNKDKLQRDDNSLNYRQMMQSEKSLKIITRWFFEHNLLIQFALVSKLLYEDWWIIFVFFLFFFFSLSSFGVE